MGQIGQIFCRTNFSEIEKKHFSKSPPRSVPSDPICPVLRNLLKLDSKPK